MIEGDSMLIMSVPYSKLAKAPSWEVGGSIVQKRVADGAW